MKPFDVGFDGRGRLLHAELPGLGRSGEGSASERDAKNSKKNRHRGGAVHPTHVWSSSLD
jgi:hypothetical protein